MGVSTPTIDRWIQAGLPYDDAPGRPGKSYQFDVPTVVIWRLEREREAGASSGELRGLRARKLAADARLSEMAADREAGQLLARADVDAAVIGAFMRVRTRLLAIPNTVTPLVVGVVDPRHVERLLKEKICEVLLELSETDVARLMGK